eukprot:TRINITY_DN13622_c0_g1_i1.p1 TRINITY_DN13622_c0_g1~~TRINITY_DN13622_c0_g1_i1.p1  ORF type:complete len:904 (+),score=162.71 TRINITY_DN13622_c0_g1_i1:50-2761(+)
MPFSHENQLPQPKSTIVLKRDTPTKDMMSPSAVLPLIRSPSVGSRSPPQPAEVKLRQELQELRNVAEIDGRKERRAAPHFGNTEALLKKIAQLELDNAKLRAATLLPPSPSPSGNRSEYPSPAKILLENPRVTTPPPDRSPSRKLDMGIPVSPETPDVHDCPPVHPSMLPRPRTPTSISPTSLASLSAPPPPPSPPFPVPTQRATVDRMDRIIDKAQTVPLDSEPAPAPFRTSMSPVDTIDHDTHNDEPPSEESKAAIGSILSKMFGGADITLVESGIVSSHTSTAVYPTLSQPVFSEERWVSRGIYPTMKEGDIVQPGVPPPAVDATHFEILLESGNMFKYETRGVMGLYNSSPNKQFTLSFVIPSPVVPMGDCTKTGSTYVIKLEPGEAKPFVKGPIDGYKVTVQYTRPGSAFLKRELVPHNQIVDDFMKTGGALRDCINRNVPFVDAAFPPKQESLSRSWEGVTTLRAWKRLSDVYTDTEVGLFVVPVQPNTLRLCNLADIHSLSAFAMLAEDPSLIKEIFVRDANEEAVGAYKLRLFNGSVETDMILDAFLPFLGYCPAFAAHLTHVNELWIPLLHKAYAKLKGSYVAARKGTVMEVMRAFTGLPAETIDLGTLTSSYEDIYARLQKAHDSGCVCVVTTPKDATLERKQKAAGLIGGCGYAVTKVARVGGIMLVQVRNPWLSPRLWCGKWGNSSVLWDEQPEVVRQLDMTFEDNGCLWLEISEVCEWFTEVGFLHNKAWYRMCTKMELADGVPSCVAQVTVTAAARVHISALMQTDQRTNSWCNVKVGILQKVDEKWQTSQESWLDVVPDSTYWFVVLGDTTSAKAVHFTLHSTAAPGDVSLFRPSPSLVQLLHVDKISFAPLPTEASPVLLDQPVTCHVHTHNPDSRPVAVTTATFRF